MVIHSCNSSNKGRALSFQSSLEYTMSTMLAAATQKDPVRSKQIIKLRILKRVKTESVQMFNG